MKILHCCFSGGYTENCAYQENMLTELHRKHGHEVLVAASDESVSGGVHSYTDAGEFVTGDGIVVRRMKPSRLVPAPLRYKLRFFPEFKALLEQFEPDIIFFHSVAAHELLTAADYKRRHPGTVLAADSHASLENSARNTVTKTLQHRVYYRSIYERTKNVLDAMYYIGMGEKEYMIKVFGAKPEEISFLPLGGLMTGPEEKAETRKKIRAGLGIPDDCVVICYSGKINEHKHPERLLRAMELCGDRRLRMIFIGTAQGENKDMFDAAAAKDDRIINLGWKTSEELRDHLCASDVYVITGRPTATMQTSLCCGTPVITYVQYTYTEQFDSGSGVLFFETPEQLADMLGSILSGELSLESLSGSAIEYARNNLDYDRQAYGIESLVPGSRKKNG